MNRLFLTFLITSNLFAGIEKINDELYYYKKNYIYFALERITDKTILFWKDHTTNQLKLLEQKAKNNEKSRNKEFKLHEEYLDLYVGLSDEEYSKARASYPRQKELDAAGELYILTKQIINDISYSIIPFQHMLKCSTNKKDHIWVAYATKKEVTDYAINSLQINGDVQISFTIGTNDELPIYCPMGIFRSLDATEKGLSISLHSAAALLISKIYNNKKYLFSRPLDIMKELLIKSLPKESVCKEYEQKNIRWQPWYGTITIFNPENNKEKTMKQPSFLKKVQAFHYSKASIILVDILSLSKIIAEEKKDE